MKYNENIRITFDSKKYKLELQGGRNKYHAYNLLQSQQAVKVQFGSNEGLFHIKQPQFDTLSTSTARWVIYRTYALSNFAKFTLNAQLESNDSF